MPDDIVVVGVNTGGLYDQDTAERINSFIAQTGVSFPIVQDENQVVGYETDLAISPFPVDIVVDADGIISAVLSEYHPETLRDAITAAR